ncbi:MAG: deoxyribodipyrimidine photo-lyase [Anaerolineae bacterium]|nr:deoxyribodipyrimidine photo-lyase [Anaerolineae bacterium]
MTVSLWWIRRDFRLADNQTLATALAESEHVYPIFILDPKLINSDYTGQKRLAFMFEGLRHLAADLQARGSYLTLYEGDVAAQLEKLLSETRAEAIYAQEDFSPYARHRDKQVAESLPLRLVPGLTLHHPTAVLKSDGDPYTVFTPYSRTWKKQPLPETADLRSAPKSISTPKGLKGVDIPDKPALDEAVPFPASEKEAQQRLYSFTGQISRQPWAFKAASVNKINTIYAYEETRDRTDLKGTSQLSPYLRFGMISARQAVVAALKASEKADDSDAANGAAIWLNELIWRDFYIAILYHFPYVRQSSFREKYNQVPWINNEDDFEAWCRGKTGYPVVDAGMRQLVESGWMHNRARMIVAAFLVKHLLIDWRWGERFFMQHLVDGDPAANNGGWQWTAGTGTDAPPYFRVFNPILQGEKFDPDGAYIRCWVPELANVPDKYIHTPWKMPTEIQHEANCRIGQDYPKPLVEHKEARQRALAAYDQVK